LDYSETILRFGWSEEHRFILRLAGASTRYAPSFDGDSRLAEGNGSGKKNSASIRSFYPQLQLADPADLSAGVCYMKLRTDMLVLSFLTFMEPQLRPPYRSPLIIRIRIPQLAARLSAGYLYETQNDPHPRSPAASALRVQEYPEGTGLRTARIPAAQGQPPRPQP
jgi:hypothetical protein